jgi:hypothetical protein
MIPYEELCAALERFAQVSRGGAPAASNTAMPTPRNASSFDAGAGDDRTHVGAPDNEIDLGDVLTDEENR